MSVVRKKPLTINGGEARHFEKVKGELIDVDDEAEQLQPEEEHEDEDEDKMTLSQLISYRRKTAFQLDVSLHQVIERSEAKRKRGTVSEVDVELENVEIETKRSKRTNSDHICDDYEVEYARITERAKNFQAKLNPEFPSFIKIMFRSIVNKPFWMSVPTIFSKQHMPDYDESMVLVVGENDEEDTVRYLEKSHAFSGGWQGFSRKHKLHEKDALIFQMLIPYKFKVHILRQNSTADLDVGALNHTAKQINLISKSLLSKVDKVDLRSSNEATNKNAQPNLHKEIVHDYSLSEPDTTFLEAFLEDSDQSDKCMNNSRSKNTDCMDSAASFVDFRGFTITIHGFEINSILPENIRRKYYELCLSRKMYLHERLLETIQPSVAAGLISKTVEIADAIRSSKAFPSQDKFIVWDKTLEGFVSLGMDVEFIRSRLNHLLRLALQSEVMPEFNKYSEAILEQTHLDEYIKILETKYNATKLELTRLEEDINRLNQVKNDLEIEIHTMKEKVERYELTFQQVACAAW